MRLLILFAAALTPIHANAQRDVAILVNSSNPVDQLSKRQIADLYMKDLRQWPDGTPVRFFDRSGDSKIRQTFLQEIVRKSSREMELYWIGQKLYSGNSAPTEVSSDSLTASLVSRFRGGIGYVSPDFDPPKGVKKIKVTGTD